MRGDAVGKFLSFEERLASSGWAVAAVVPSSIVLKKVRVGGEAANEEKDTGVAACTPTLLRDLLGYRR